MAVIISRLLVCGKPTVAAPLSFAQPLHLGLRHFTVWLVLFLRQSAVPYRELRGVLAYITFRIVKFSIGFLTCDESHIARGSSFEGRRQYFLRFRPWRWLPSLGADVHMRTVLRKPDAIDGTIGE